MSMNATLPDLQSDIDDLIKAIELAIKDAAMDLHGNIIEENPVDHGISQNSWEISGSSEEYTISSDVEYIINILDGHEPIESDHVLHFMVDGKDVFTYYIGAVKPDPFIDRACDTTESKLQDFIDMAIAEVS